jgi:hypothetical protein
MQKQHKNLVLCRLRAQDQLLFEDQPLILSQIRRVQTFKTELISLKHMKP